MEAHSRPLAKASGHDEGAECYVERGAPIDRAHRAFELARSLYLEPRLPEFPRFREIVDDLRSRYRRWADNLARDFTRVCREHGFLPSPDLQQRGFYEQVVQPLIVAGDRVAIILVDALRYEMAAELAEGLKAPGVTLDLRPRLAELPTITAVGMNVLAPLASQGRLRPVINGRHITGFRSGEFIVDGPDGRARAMGLRSVGKAATQVTLAEVVNSSSDQLKKRLDSSRLVLVHSRQIDDAGEANLGVTAFEPRGFATSFVVVSDNDLHFHKFDDVYRKVLQELSTASCPRGALPDIIGPMDRQDRRRRDGWWGRRIRA
jgi:PglZ domain/P-loop Domain of unknown function (DUF2791)